MKNLEEAWEETTEIMGHAEFLLAIEKALSTDVTRDLLMFIDREYELEVFKEPEEDEEDEKELWTANRETGMKIEKGGALYE